VFEKNRNICFCGYRSKKGVKIMQIDEPIISFVKVLNRVEGVYPASSCGGHERPKGKREMSRYKCEAGTFSVIMKIRNPKFLKELQNLVERHRDKSLFEYNPFYKKWRLSGTHEVKNKVYEPWVNKYLTEQARSPPAKAGG
jgi:tRNA(Phe) wybutosine-synthesizing methylase Tyw3